MQLKEYFESNKGVGIMSTADLQGRVNAAIYARPHVMADGTLAFIMRDRLTYRNITQNPYASYLFIEKAVGYKGARFFLNKVKEDDNAELLKEMTRRCLSPEDDAAKGPKFIVYFKIEKALKLIGGESLKIDPG